MNICAAVIGADFKEWVAEQVEERNAVMAQQKEVMISMDPVMAAKFAASSHVSRKCDLCLLGHSTDLFYRCERHLSQHVEDVKQTEKNLGPDQGRQGSGCQKGS